MVDIFISGENIAIPPRIDTYEKVAENVFVSKLQQTEEREGNIRLAKFLAKKLMNLYSFCHIFNRH